MKNFQRNLFIILAIALCGTCAYQWYLQAVQLNNIEKLNGAIYQQAKDIQGYTNSIKNRDDEIVHLHLRHAYYKQVAASNDQWAITEKREVARLQSSADIMSNEIVQYKAALTNFEGKLKEAYDGEKELAAQRDEFVKKLNDSIKAQNDLTAKYNELVDRFNKLQATNAPAK
jgi:chromosome segregation ATPase